MGKENLLSSVICGLITLAIVFKLTTFVRNIDVDNALCSSPQVYDELANNTLRCASIKYLGRDVVEGQKMYYFLRSKPEMHLVKVVDGNVTTAPVDVCGINIHDLQEFDIVNGVSRATYLSNFTLYVVFINLTSAAPESTCLFKGDSLLSDVYFGTNFYIVKAEGKQIREAVLKPDSLAPEWVTLKELDRSVKWLHISDGFVDYRTDKPIHRIPLINCNDPGLVDEPACIQRLTWYMLNVFWCVAIVCIAGVVLFTMAMDWPECCSAEDDRSEYEPI